MIRSIRAGRSHHETARRLAKPRTSRRRDLRRQPCHGRPPGPFHQFRPSLAPWSVRPEEGPAVVARPEPSDDSGRTRTRARDKRGPAGRKCVLVRVSLNEHQVIKIYTTWDRAEDAALRYGVKLSIIHSVRNSSAYIKWMLAASSYEPEASTADPEGHRGICGTNKKGAAHFGCCMAAISKYRKN